MSAKELMNEINGYTNQLPVVRNVAEAYAEVLAPLISRLSSEEVAQIVALGALIQARSTRLVPVLTWEQAGQLPGQSVVDT